MSTRGEADMSPAAVRVKEEQEWDDIGTDECGASEAAAASLYAEHEVKRELVLGPERLQPQDVAYTIPQVLLGAEWCRVEQEPAGAGPGHAPRSGDSRGEQLALRTCSVSLQRLPLDDELHECTSCRRTFLHECTLRTHLCVHSANITKSKNVFAVSKRKQGNSCDYCGKEFRFKSNLTQHIRTHTGEKPFSCNICKQKFSQKHHLDLHMRIHTGEKPFSCDICKRTFSRKDHLDVHMQIHTGEKPFSCNVCKRKFSRKHHLDTHMRIHTGEKPFSCDICKRTFSRKDHLDVHMQIHMGEKPFSRIHMQKKYSHKFNLGKHMLIHAGHKPYSCNICYKHFKQYSYFDAS